jgi:hypothetical protein
MIGYRFGSLKDISQEDAIPDETTICKFLECVDTRRTFGMDIFYGSKIEIWKRKKYQYMRF